MNNCTLDCIQIIGELNLAKMCSFTQDQCVQDTVQFVQSYYCIFNGSFMALALLGIPLFLLMFKALHVIAHFYLSPSVEEIITQFKISPIFAGVTLLAFANGAPDVMTAIIAGSSDSDTTALIPFGSIFGACLFCAGFVFYVVIKLMPNKVLSIKPQQIILPLTFYVIGILFIIAVTIFYEKMNMILASVLLLLYIIYIIIVLKNERQHRKNISLLTQSQATLQQFKQTQRDSILEENPGVVYKLNKNTQKIMTIILSKIIPPFKLDNWNPYITVFSLVCSPFIIVLGFFDIKTIFTKYVGPVPTLLIISIPSILLLIYTIFCLIKKVQPKIIRIFSLYSFFVSTALLTYICAILINFVELVQILTGANSVFLGLTVFAWANSIGDYLTIHHFAKIGNSGTAIAGIYSGQLFNFLLGFGVSLFIQSIDGQYEYKLFDFKGQAYDIISDSIIMIVIFAGLIFLFVMLVATIVLKGNFSEKFGKFANYYYIALNVICCVLGVLTDFFHEIACKIE